MKPTTFAPLDGGRRTNWGVVEVLGNHHISTFARYWLSRGYGALLTLALLVGAWFEPDSLAYELLDKGGPNAWRMVVIVCGVCCLGLLDVVANDLIRRTSMGFTKRHRHVVYFLIALGNFAVAYVFVTESGNRFRALLLPYCLNGVFCAFVAVLDLFERHRAQQACPPSTID